MKTREELIEAAEASPDWHRYLDQDDLVDDRLTLGQLMADFAFEQIEAYKAEVMDAIEAVERSNYGQIGCLLRIRGSRRGKGGYNQTMYEPLTIQLDDYRDWRDDAGHENGSYSNRCMYCWS